MEATTSSYPAIPDQPAVREQPVHPDAGGDLRPSSKTCYREWSPLIKLLSQIPTRIHRNIVGYDLVRFPFNSMILKGFSYTFTVRKGYK